MDATTTCASWNANAIWRAEAAAEATPTRPDVPLSRAQKAAMNLAPRVRLHPKIGRNAQCPCGRGAKFKKCCGRG